MLDASLFLESRRRKGAKRKAGGKIEIWKTGEKDKRKDGKKGRRG